MTNLKKILAGALALCMTSAMFASCGDTASDGDTKETTTKAATGAEGGDDASEAEDTGDTGDTGEEK
ncbi:MAG: carbohydrate ABC transporter substrate-binding protein, partial [Ruminococcus sp.]|nr:carbohydrate ABC transporter substrate-binding protein [Ruminococcus sp.]MBQ1432094.1 carbohydrate ABC transporter substrate-binding protein [Ruminococcus sp.]